VDPADPKAEAPTEPAAPRVDDKPAAEEPSAQRPSWLPDKFASPDALKSATVELAKKQGAPGYVIRGIEMSESGQEVSDAYKEFERKLDPNAGKPAEKVEEKPATEEKPAETPAPLVKTAEEKAHEVETYGSYVAGMLDNVGMRATDLGAEFESNGGKLTEATYDKFAKAGVTKTFLNSYIAGMVGTQTQLAEAHVKEVKTEIFGGEEGFVQVAVWAQANMSKDQHEVYTAMTNSGSLVAAKEAARMLKGWHDKANGKQPTLVVPDAPPVPENKGYESRQQMMADMNDLRYKKGDKAFHKQVEEKLKYTNF
jgi:hypothetical protein